jgi:signal transduction histidine kinase
MKSERMKVALITNVSHDLKTPLTSIISYVDLLSKEENLTDSARDYVKILSEKSSRLSNMVSDLFDLAKSTSGNMPLDIESIDMKKLIEQTLADMEDKVEKSGLLMKVVLPEKPLFILADGKKLYRVFQNVIDNALKYSFKGTRVYITLEKRNGHAIAAIKNTAGYEMDFTADEILQRFNRGDKSRTTEGSGLGLSIAESFTQVCGGTLRVDIDGDLFKVTISFPAAEPAL